MSGLPTPRRRKAQPKKFGSPVKPSEPKKSAPYSSSFSSDTSVSSPLSAALPKSAHQRVYEIDDPSNEKYEICSDGSDDDYDDDYEDEYKDDYEEEDAESEFEFVGLSALKTSLGLFEDSDEDTGDHGDGKGGKHADGYERKDSYDHHGSYNDDDNDNDYDSDDNDADAVTTHTTITGNDTVDDGNRNTFNGKDDNYISEDNSVKYANYENENDDEGDNGANVDERAASVNTVNHDIHRTRQEKGSSDKRNTNAKDRNNGDNDDTVAHSRSGADGNGGHSSTDGNDASRSVSTSATSTTFTTSFISSSSSSSSFISSSSSSSLSTSSSSSTSISRSHAQAEHTPSSSPSRAHFSLSQTSQSQQRRRAGVKTSAQKEQNTDSRTSRHYGSSRSKHSSSPPVTPRFPLPNTRQAKHKRCPDVNTHSTSASKANSAKSQSPSSSKRSPARASRAPKRIQKHLPSPPPYSHTRAHAPSRPSPPHSHTHARKAAAFHTYRSPRSRQQEIEKEKTTRPPNVVEQLSLAKQRITACTAQLATAHSRVELLEKQLKDYRHGPGAVTREVQLNLRFNKLQRRLEAKAAENTELQERIDKLQRAQRKDREQQQQLQMNGYAPGRFSGDSSHDHMGIGNGNGNVKGNNNGRTEMSDYEDDDYDDDLYEDDDEFEEKDGEGNDKAKHVHTKKKRLAKERITTTTNNNKSNSNDNNTNSSTSKNMHTQSKKASPMSESVALRMKVMRGEIRHLKCQAKRYDYARVMDLESKLTARGKELTHVRDELKIQKQIEMLRAREERKQQHDKDRGTVCMAFVNGLNDRINQQQQVIQEMTKMQIKSAEQARDQQCLIQELRNEGRKDKASIQTLEASLERVQLKFKNGMQQLASQHLKESLQQQNHYQKQVRQKRTLTTVSSRASIALQAMQLSQLQTTTYLQDSPTKHVTPDSGHKKHEKGAREAGGRGSEMGTSESKDVNPSSSSDGGGKNEAADEENKETGNASNFNIDDVKERNDRSNNNKNNESKQDDTSAHGHMATRNHGSDDQGNGKDGDDDDIFGVKDETSTTSMAVADTPDDLRYSDADSFFDDSDAF